MADDRATRCWSFDDERCEVGACCFAWPCGCTEAFVTVLTDVPVRAEHLRHRHRECDDDGEERDGACPIRDRPGESSSPWPGGPCVGGPGEVFRELRHVADEHVERDGSDQVVVGWRAMNRPGVKVGIKLFTPLDDEGKTWRTTWIDDNQMACEDLCLADLDGDGKLDIIASGRATHNLVIYFNQTPGGTVKN